METLTVSWSIHIMRACTIAKWHVEEMNSKLPIRTYWERSCFRHPRRMYHLLSVSLLLRRRDKKANVYQPVCNRFNYTFWRFVKLFQRHTFVRPIYVEMVGSILYDRLIVVWQKQTINTHLVDQRFHPPSSHRVHPCVEICWFSSLIQYPSEQEVKVWCCLNKTQLKALIKYGHCLMGR